MKLRFKHQKFQMDAANAVCDVFAGQPFLTQTYRVDIGSYSANQQQINLDYTGWRNEPVIQKLSSGNILKNIKELQQTYQIQPSNELFAEENKDTGFRHFNLTIEMETGVGKTYTYIKTMYELNKRFGWSKFIVVVPSVAIREGVYKSFQITEDHFADEYGKKIRYFIYNSALLNDIDHFAGDSAINCMIINSQAFNAKGKDARRIYMRLDDFRSRKPIDILAKTNPIMIIDEPQSVEGAKTKIGLKDFHPLITLRYSATHRKDSIYNMIYRLDAVEAYNKKLVKKIVVTGISPTGNAATNGYLYLESINVYPNKNPTATLEFDVKGKSGVKSSTRTLAEGANVFAQSGELDEYKNGYIITRINNNESIVELQNGIKLHPGDVTGDVSEDQIRRVQIRETIKTHLERERELFYKGIKVLSLFFIDEVAKYKQYDKNGIAFNGVYADIFEEEYKNAVTNFQLRLNEKEYADYLNSISAESTHAGYFSIDKNKKTGVERFVDSKLERGTTESSDTDAYDLIMKNKERLLDIKEPVRFIFSHSALREGWDNPNVFQICTLKQSSAEVRKRQEVGRGLRLCVNQEGDRMDENVLGADVQKVNVLTVIASESYESFARGLQDEIAEAVTSRPRLVTADLFKDKKLQGADGTVVNINESAAMSIFESLIINGYVKQGALTGKYYEDKANGCVRVPDEVKGCEASVVDILDSVYDENRMKPEDGRANDVTLAFSEEKANRREFQELWKRINTQSAYVVDFDTEELVKKCVYALDTNLNVPKIFVNVETGAMKEIKSKEELEAGNTFVKQSSEQQVVAVAENSTIKYDLIGKIVENTKLTRSTVADILTRMNDKKFEQFKDNPEAFIIKASELISEQIATVVVEHIKYDRLKSAYDMSVFTEPTLRGSTRTNAMPTQKHLYDYIIFQSTNEKKFAEKLDVSKEVAVYVKLPSGFYINTPVGKYNPDWAIAFNEGAVKHIYFVAETKGSMSTMELRKIEKAKIDCAREHFKTISGENVKYDVVDSYESLMNLVMN
jgi:type III restriction enzyme